jgi:hypothetical protein
MATVISYVVRAPTASNEAQHSGARAGMWEHLNYAHRQRHAGEDHRDGVWCRRQLRWDGSGDPVSFMAART